MKRDTETLAQIFIPYKNAVEPCTADGLTNRQDHNDWVWSQVLDRRVVDRKCRKYRFHHEITTDGVAVSLLYSREAAETVHIRCKDSSGRRENKQM